MKAFFKTVDVSKVNYKALFDVLYEKDDEKYAVNKLKDLGYTVEKTAEFSQDTLKSIADGLGLMLSAKPVNNLTPQEIFAKAKAEFAREAERDETKKKLAEEDAQGKIDEFAAYLKGVDASKIKLQALFDVMWDKDSEQNSITRLKSAGYTVEKTAEFSQDTLKSIADGLGLMLSAKPVNNLTPQEIFAKAKAEFAREAERDETKKKLVSIFPPILHKLLEFAVDKAYEESEYSNIIEFSEDDKTSMATKLKEFSEGESPFKELFKNYTESKEFNKDTEETPAEKAKRIAELY